MANSEKNDTLILGAGAAGLSAAIELWKADAPFTVVEKETQVGGLARTLELGEFRTDIGPHRFFSRNQYLYSFIEDVLGEEWIPVERFTRFFIQGKFFLYPVQLGDVVKKLGVVKSTRVLLDYLCEVAKRPFHRHDPRNFEEYVIRNFGRSLAELNMLNYTEKIWGLPCSELSTDWAMQRIKGLSFVAAVKSAIFKAKQGPKTLVDRFFYPEYGAGYLYEQIQNKISQDRDVHLGSLVKSIDHDGSSVTRVRMEVDGEEFLMDPAWVISTIPITDVLNFLNPSPPQDVIDAAAQLKWRGIVHLFLKIDKPQVTRDQWMYFPDTEIPFGRVSEMKNFSPRMSPADKTSLLVEYFVWDGDEVWNATTAELFERSIEWLDRFGFVKREEVIDCHSYRIRKAYPVYDIGYEERLGVIKDYLAGFQNFFYAGRGARFKYTNQDHSLEMGIMAAKSIIDGKRYNIDEAGSEKEYMESYPLQGAGKPSS